MEVTIQKMEHDYKMICDYFATTNLQGAWQFIATNSGLAIWFPELSVDIEKGILIFQAGDFREEMAILAYQELENVSYQWDTATVAFHFEEVETGCRIRFEEWIPYDFGNEFTNAEKDLTGWLVQNERLEAILSQKEEIDRDSSRAKWQNFVQKELSETK